MSSGLSSVTPHLPAHSNVPVHLPNNVAVGEFHRDRDYSHGEGETNFWLPVTNAWDSNSVWIEGEEGAEDFTPYEVAVGQLLVFDGVNLAHGNKMNTTGKTRVSFCFPSDSEVQVPSEQWCLRQHRRAVCVGGYFEELVPEREDERAGVTEPERS